MINKESFKEKIKKVYSNDKGRVLPLKLNKNSSDKEALLYYTQWVYKRDDYPTKDLINIFLTGKIFHPLCLICKKPVPFKNKRFNKTCSSECGIQFMLQNKKIESYKKKNKYNDSLKFSSKEELIIILKKLFEKKKGIIDTSGYQKFADIIKGIYKYTDFLKLDFTINQRIYLLLHNVHNHRLCKICGKPTNYDFKNNFKTYCSYTCRNQNRTNELTKKRKEETKYQSLEEFRNILSKLFLKNGKVWKNKTTEKNYPWIIKDIYKYTDFIKLDLSYRERIYIILKKYTEHPLCPQCSESLPFYKGDFRKFCSVTCGGKYNSKIGLENMTNTSKGEQELLDFVKQYYPEANKKKFTINGSILEVDIFIEELNLAIEYNGIYWHSENSAGRDNKYHLNKLNKLKEKGIHLIQFFDKEWSEKQDIVKSIILTYINKFDNKIFARKCVIKELSLSEEKQFLETNHIQGYKESNVRIGLYYKDQLVYILTFRKPRFTKKYDWELLRSCTKLNTSVIGGFSKLLKYAIEHHCKGSIISYIDKRLFTGRSYEKLNFVRLKDSPPSYYYTDNYIRLYNRIQFQKHKLSVKLENFDPNLTEWENMNNNGYDRIWDCGNFVFLLT